MEKRNRLKQHIYKDLRLSKKPAKTTGFNAAIPTKLKFLPPNADGIRRWIKYDRNVEDLASMKKVFDGISNLRYE